MNEWMDGWANEGAVQPDGALSKKKKYIIRELD